jgi:hypothetical protein
VPGSWVFPGRCRRCITAGTHIPWTSPATAEQVGRLAADVGRLAAHVDRRFAEVDRRFGRLENRMDGLHRTVVVVAAVSVVLGVAALNFATFQLIAG